MPVLATIVIRRMFKPFSTRIRRLFDKYDEDLPELEMPKSLPSVRVMYVVLSVFADQYLDGAESGCSRC